VLIQAAALHLYNFCREVEALRASSCAQRLITAQPHKRASKDPPGASSAELLTEEGVRKLVHDLEPGLLYHHQLVRRQKIRKDYGPVPKGKPKEN